MRIHLLGALSLWLAAGAAAETVPGELSMQTFHSADSAANVVSCLQGRNGVNAALETEGGSKVVVVRNGSGRLMMTFAVYPDGPGSRIEYRPKVANGAEAWRQCIASEAQGGLSTSFRGAG